MVDSRAPARSESPVKPLISCNTPRFSVVIATYNRAHVIARALDSLLRQTIDDFEIVVVDDGSTDDTAAMVRQIGRQKVRLLRQSNQGLSRARNAGAAASVGEYVTFLDDDDEALPEWLETVGAEIQRSAPAVVCCGAFFVFDGGTREVVRLPVRKGPHYDDQEGLFLAGTYILRRDVFDEVGGFAPRLPSRHSSELAFRLLPLCVQRGWSVVSVQRPLVRIHRAPFEERPLPQPARMLASAEYILGHHRERISRHPHALSNYQAIAGVAAARIGRYPEARRYLRAAISSNPRAPKHYLRLLLAMVPPLARRVWGTAEGGGVW